MPTEPSGPGRTRTADRHLVRVLPSPLGYRTVIVVFWRQAAEAGIEPTRRRSEHLILPLDDSAVSMHRASRPTVSNSGRRTRTFTTCFKGRRPTVSRPPILDSGPRSALRESNPPCQIGSLGPSPLGQGHVHGMRKERESNPQGFSLDRFQGGCHRQLACPSGRLRWQESNLRRGG